MAISASSRRRALSARLKTGVLVVAVVAFGGGVSSGSADTAGPACDRPVNVAGLGRACPVPGGWQVLLGDGTTVSTHGHDPLSLVQLTVQPAMPSCANDPRTQFHNVLIYAHASDRPNLYTKRLADLRGMAALANGVLRSESSGAGRPMDFRFLCANGILVVNDAPLLTREQDTTFDAVVTGVRALGFTSPMAKYWIWYEGHPPGTQAGTATLEYDDRAAADNRNNFGPSYGVTWGVEPDDDGAVTMLHQGGHMLGAVQLTASHSTGAGHCTDGSDVMCAPDGGPAAGQYSDRICSSVRFDCNRDDYFNPAPASGSWLATHWNIASPFDRFVAGCTYASGVLAVGAGGSEAEGVTERAHAIPATCQGRPYALTAMVPQPVGVLPLTSRQVGSLPVPDVNVCWYQEATKLRCDTASGPDRGVVPAGATAARVVLYAGAAATYVLSAI